MRKFIRVATRKTAAKLAPWAAVIAVCEGGFIAFEFRTDYDVWKAQR